MHNEVLSNVNGVHDLGINVTNYLSPSDHVKSPLRPTNVLNLSIDVLFLVILICLFVLIKCMLGRY